MDRVAGYRRALFDHLPNAALVVVHFHTIRLANAAIGDVRRRVQQATLGHRGHKGDPLYRARRAFLTGIDRPSDDRIAWVMAMLDAGDPHGEVYTAIDAALARRRFTVFFEPYADAEVPEFIRLATTIDR